MAFAWKETEVPNVVLDEAEEIEKVNIYYEMAEFNRIKHRYEESLKLHSLCFDVVTKKYGPASVQVAQTLNNIGVVHEKRGEYEEALQKYNKCLEIQTKSLGPASV